MSETICVCVPVFMCVGVCGCVWVCVDVCVCWDWYLECLYNRVDLYQIFQTLSTEPVR